MSLFSHSVRGILQRVSARSGNGRFHLGMVLASREQCLKKGAATAAQRGHMPAAEEHGEGAIPRGFDFADVRYIDKCRPVDAHEPSRVELAFEGG